MPQTRQPLPPSQYLLDVYPKTLGLLHFTAGTTIDGALNEWARTPERVATSLINGMDGEVFQAFPPQYWAHHLGIDTWAHDKRSVAIEIVNPGPLVRKQSDLYWWPGNFTTKYCSIVETEKYVSLKKPVRGFLYYASFPVIQMESVAVRMVSLSKRFGIPLVIPPVEQRGVMSHVKGLNNGWVDKWNGWASHDQFRDDKFDVGPAFDWVWLEKRLDELTKMSTGEPVT